MRLFVVDNNLTDKTGHFFALDRWLQEEANTRSIDALFFINRSAPNEIAKTLSARSIFSCNSFSDFSGDKYCADVDNFLQVGPQFAKELQALNKEKLSGSDIVFFPLVNQNDLLGCALWLNHMPRETRPYVCINFMLSNFVNPQNDSLTVAGLLYRSAAKILLKAQGKEKLVYTAQSSRMAEFLSWLLSHPVTASPMLNAYNLAGNADQPDAVKKITAGACRIAIIGCAKSEKGFDLVPDLLRLLTAKIPNPNFFVQVTTEHKAWTKEIAGIQTMTNVELHHGALAERDYFEKLQNADIVLLPYRPLEYKYMTSGIFSEAVAMGKVIVAPDSSWMSEQIKNRKGAGKLFASFDAQSIADAVLAALKDYETLAADAGRYAESWKQEQNLSKYIDELLTAYYIKEIRNVGCV